MILGYDTLMGVVVDTPQTPIQNITYTEISNCIIDELHMRSKVINQEDKTNYTNDTVLLAEFLGDMEAGNIGMRENKIVKLRLKRREKGHVNFYNVAEFDFKNDYAYKYHDYGTKANVVYEYCVVPVDQSGFEGKGAITEAIINFDGWWVIDLDNPEELSVQFVYNMDSVSMSTEQDRVELSTFAKFPYIKYGAKHVKRGTLSSLFISDDCGMYMPIMKQIQKVDQMVEKHKSYMLKDGNGHRYIVDIHSPSYKTYEGLKDLSDISIEWYQVDEVND